MNSLVSSKKKKRASSKKKKKDTKNVSHNESREPHESGKMEIITEQTSSIEDDLSKTLVKKKSISSLATGLKRKVSRTFASTPSSVGQSHSNLQPEASLESRDGSKKEKVHSGESSSATTPSKSLPTTKLARGMHLLGGENGRRATQNEIIATFAQQRRPTLTQSNSSPTLPISKLTASNNSPQDQTKIGLATSDSSARFPRQRTYDGGVIIEDVIEENSDFEENKEQNMEEETDEDEEGGFCVIKGDPAIMTDTITASTTDLQQAQFSELPLLSTLRSLGGGGEGGGGKFPLEHAKWLNSHFKRQQQFRSKPNWHNYYMRNTNQLQDTPVIKIAVLGKVAVGKTSLCKKFCENTFTVDTSKPTILFEMHQTLLSVAGVECNLLIYDLAGNLSDPQFLSHTENFITSCHCIVLAYETCGLNKTTELQYCSQNHVKIILDKIRPLGIPIALVGTKFDLIQDNPEAIACNLNVAKGFKERISNLALIRFTSAKTGGYVTTFFTEVIQLALIYQAKSTMCICMNCMKVVNALITGHFSQWAQYFKKYRTKLLQESKLEYKQAKYKKKYFGEENESDSSVKAPLVPTTPQQDFERDENDSIITSSEEESGEFSDEDNDRVEETIGDFYDLFMFVCNAIWGCGQTKASENLNSDMQLSDKGSSGWCCG